MFLDLVIKSYQLTEAYLTSEGNIVNALQSIDLIHLIIITYLLTVSGNNE